MTASTDTIKKSAYPAHLGWRLLALSYDCLPMIPLLMLVSAVLLWLHGGRTVESNFWLATAQFIALWSSVGAYFVLSWHRGGQTMGMRPWRLQVLANNGRLGSLKMLSLRYLMATLTPGVCLLWTLIDRERRGLHDLVSGTVLVRLER